MKQYILLHLTQTDVKLPQRKRFIYENTKQFAVFICKW